MLCVKRKSGKVQVMEQLTTRVQPKGRNSCDIVLRELQNKRFTRTSPQDLMENNLCPDLWENFAVFHKDDKSERIYLFYYCHDTLSKDGKVYLVSNEKHRENMLKRNKKNAKVHSLSFILQNLRKRFSLSNKKEETGSDNDISKTENSSKYLIIIDSKIEGEIDLNWLPSIPKETLLFLSSTPNSINFYENNFSFNLKNSLLSHQGISLNDTFQTIKSDMKAKYPDQVPFLFSTITSSSLQNTWDLPYPIDQSLSKYFCSEDLSLYYGSKGIKGNNNVTISEGTLKNDKSIMVKRYIKQDSADQYVINITKELTISRKFNYPSIESFIGWSSIDGDIYLIKESFHGKTLTELLQIKNKTKTDWELKWNLIKTLILTMKYIHSMGYLHSDLTSDNIMISEDFMKLQIVNLGNAKDINKSIYNDRKSEIINLGKLIYGIIILGTSLIKDKSYQKFTVKSIEQPKIPNAFPYHTIKLIQKCWNYKETEKFLFNLLLDCYSYDRQKSLKATYWWYLNVKEETLIKCVKQIQRWKVTFIYVGNGINPQKLKRFENRMRYFNLSDQKLSSFNSFNAEQDATCENLLEEARFATTIILDIGCKKSYSVGHLIHAIGCVDQIIKRGKQKFIVIFPWGLKSSGSEAFKKLEDDVNTMASKKDVLFFCSAGDLHTTCDSTVPAKLCSVNASVIAVGSAYKDTKLLKTCRTPKYNPMTNYGQDVMYVGGKNSIQSTTALALAVSVMWSMDSKLTAIEISKLLKKNSSNNSSSSFGVHKKKNKFGHGIVNINNILMTLKGEKINTAENRIRIENKLK